MLTIDQRKHLASRWREIIRTTESTAVEWPEIARSIRQLAKGIETGDVERDSKDGRVRAVPPTAPK